MLQIEYYKRGKVDDFVKILEVSQTEAADTEYGRFETDQLRALDLLAAYYSNEGHKEKNKHKKKEFFTKANELYTAGDKIVMYDQVLRAQLFVYAQLA